MRAITQECDVMSFVELITWATSLGATMYNVSDDADIDYSVTDMSLHTLYQKVRFLYNVKRISRF